MSAKRIKRRENDGVHMFLSELTSRIVAESGIPTDRFHLGKLIMQSLKDAPDFILQINGATDDSETFGSVLERSIRCAMCFKSLGLECGDVIVLMAPNYLDLTIPFYAALYLGIIVSAVDRTLGVMELQNTFNISRPKLIFCQGEKAADVQIALNEIDLDARIISFDGGDYLCSFQEFMQEGEQEDIDDFKPADFDPEETIAFLIATSGTTGLPKAAATTHKNFAITSPYLWTRFEDFPTPTRMSLVASPLQWLTALINFVVSPIFRFTRLQTSLALTKEHCYDLINTYKPTWTVFSPTFMAAVVKAADRDECDFTCLETMLLGGSAVPADLIEELNQITPNTEVFNIYGMSELNGIGFSNNNLMLPWICGQPIGCLDYRLVDPITGEDIDEPNAPGELWLKGPGIFKEYYNNPKATEETFAEDRWFKTGDMFYRDENLNYFYVDRIKLLLKYKGNQISPIEIESVIRQHPGVLDVAVTGIPDEECGELPVALVMRREGYDVTADEIKDLVKESLIDAKQLRGGVIFVSEIPMTASTKVHRRKVKELALTWDRE